MQLTPLTDHAFRVLTYLSDHQGWPATILELSMQLGIPVNATQKVAARLTQIGVISSHRGRHGGILLSRPPIELSLGWLFRELESDLGLVACLRDSDRACPLTGHCRLTDILNQSLQAFIAVLDRFTLADLAGDPELAARLHRRGGSYP